MSESRKVGLIGICPVCKADALVVYRGKRIVMAAHPKDPPKCSGGGDEPLLVHDSRVKPHKPWM